LDLFRQGKRRGLAEEILKNIRSIFGPMGIQMGSPVKKQKTNRGRTQE
jgi:hypothetical protein